MMKNLKDLREFKTNEAYSIVAGLSPGGSYKGTLSNGNTYTRTWGSDSDDGRFLYDHEIVWHNAATTGTNVD